MASKDLEGYQDFFNSLKERIRKAQIKAALSVNRELILLYWQARTRNSRSATTTGMGG